MDEETWMVDGEALLMMMDDPLQIPRPGRVPERSFWIRILVSGGGGGAELFLENYRTTLSF